jgi:predicted nucleotidyltransferase
MLSKTNLKFASELKSSLEPLVPGIKLFAFGSRVYGKPHSESDLDILAIVPGEMNQDLKWAIRDAVFPISLHHKTFIHILPVTEKLWENSTNYYLLKQDIEHRMLAL